MAGEQEASRSNAGALTLEQTIMFLLETPLFEQLSATELAEVVGIMQVQRLREGQVLFREGDEGDAWYVIFEGMCSVRKESDVGPSRHIADLGPWTCFGEMAVLDGPPHPQRSPPSSRRPSSVPSAPSAASSPLEPRASKSCTRWPACLSPAAPDHPTAVRGDQRGPTDRRRPARSCTLLDSSAVSEQPLPAVLLAWVGDRRGGVASWAPAPARRPTRPSSTTRRPRGVRVSPQPVCEQAAAQVQQLPVVTDGGLRRPVTVDLGPGETRRRPGRGRSPVPRRPSSRAPSTSPGSAPTGCGRRATAGAAGLSGATLAAEVGAPLRVAIPHGAPCCTGRRRRHLDRVVAVVVHEQVRSACSDQVLEWTHGGVVWGRAQAPRALAAP